MRPQLKYRNGRWFQLSAGYRLRGAIANALLSFPKLLILDEPLANLDINTQLQFLEDLRDLANAREYPFAVLVTSQNLHELESIADEILFLEDGAPKFYGPRSLLGRDRPINSFELECDRGREDLLNILAPSGLVDITRIGRSMVVRVPLGVGSHELLGALVAAGVQIQYFRDISNPSRTMLRIEQ